MQALWQCSTCSHQWPARVSARCLRGNKCPKCHVQTREPHAEQYKSACACSYLYKSFTCSFVPEYHSSNSGFSVLLHPAVCVTEHPKVADAKPELLAEWDPANQRRASECTLGSKYRAGWICSTCAHHWEARVQARALQGKGCPECSKALSRKSGSA